MRSAENDCCPANRRAASITRSRFLVSPLTMKSSVDLLDRSRMADLSVSIRLLKPVPFKVVPDSSENLLQPHIVLLCELCRIESFPERHASVNVIAQVAKFMHHVLNRMISEFVLEPAGVNRSACFAASSRSFAPSCQESVHPSWDHCCRRRSK